VDPDVLSTAAALTAEERQLALIDAVIVSFPGLSRVLSPTRAIHEEHRALLATADLPTPTPEPSTGSSSTPSGTSSGNSSGTPADQWADPSASISPTPTGTPVVPATRKAALAAVIAGESVLRKQHTTAALAAAQGPLARLLAQLAAAAAQQSVLLRGAS